MSYWHIEIRRVRHSPGWTKLFCCCCCPEKQMKSEGQRTLVAVLCDPQNWKNPNAFTPISFRPTLQEWRKEEATSTAFIKLQARGEGVSKKAPHAFHAHPCGQSHSDPAHQASLPPTTTMLRALSQTGCAGRTQACPAPSVLIKERIVKEQESVLHIYVHWDCGGDIGVGWWITFRHPSVLSKLGGLQCFPDFDSHTWFHFFFPYRERAYRKAIIWSAKNNSIMAFPRAYWPPSMRNTKIN